MCCAWCWHPCCIVPNEQPCWQCQIPENILVYAPVCWCAQVATYRYEIKPLATRQEAGQLLEVDTNPEQASDFKLYIIQERCDANLAEAIDYQVGCQGIVCRNCAQSAVQLCIQHTAAVCTIPSCVCIAEMHTRPDPQPLGGLAGCTVCGLRFLAPWVLIGSRVAACSTMFCWEPVFY